jgi:type II secretory ATPase GspE/PulE/Tfp pilus assembly ATPase PilB-like protein
MPVFRRVTINPVVFGVMATLARKRKANESKAKIKDYEDQHIKLITSSVLAGKIDYAFVQGFMDHQSEWQKAGCLPIGRGVDEDLGDVVWVVAAHEESEKAGPLHAFARGGRASDALSLPPSVVSDVKVLLEEDSLRGRELVFLCTPRNVVDIGIDELFIKGRLVDAENALHDVGFADEGTVTLIDAKPVPEIDRAAVERGQGWLRNAINRGATDIHIEPVEGGGRVRVRIDGLLLESEPFVKSSLLRQVISWLKVQADVDITEQRHALDGKMKLKRHVNGKLFEVDVRYSSIPTIYGEKVVLRLLDKSKQADKYTREGGLRGVFPPHEEGSALYAAFVEAQRYSSGIVLVTGPTGCGKTTTLNTSLRYLLEKHGKTLNIVTIEDPVEYTVPGANQIQTNELADMTFANSLRAILRQYPDIVLVGEIRDSETANVAVQASLTGHMILSTLHTNDAIGCIERLIDLGVSRFLIGSTVRLLQAQRLIRLLCPGENPPNNVKGCAVRISEEESMRQILASRLAPYAERFQGRSLLESDTDVGCEWCEGMGYKGRRAVMEVIPMRPALRSAIQKGLTRDELLAVAKAHCGLRSMVECGLDLLLSGMTDISQVEELELGDG